MALRLVVGGQRGAAWVRDGGEGRCCSEVGPEVVQLGLQAIDVLLQDGAVERRRWWWWWW